MVRQSKPKPVYRVLFMQQGHVYELYASEVGSSSLFGFLEVAGLHFSRSEIIADPSEEKLRQEFAGCTRLFIPYHAVIRIDQVERAGASRIAAAADASVMPFPYPLATPKKPER
ncbi:MAG: DUF1820 family protein [Thermoanaerobaculum sp.]|nr:DUF1820 family protein [Thermoanaerobaculum sp.]MDW7968725.1 DUF1820 family protein [Thermoanaerobaculum sp.]